MQLSENEILRRVRRVEIKTRGLSDEIFAGKYHTAFRGRGMSFSEVREYPEKKATFVRFLLPRCSVCSKLGVEAKWLNYDYANKNI